MSVVDWEGESGGGGVELFEGRYRLGPVLGRGGAATVYEALDERLLRQVALKVFRHDGEPDLLRRFEAEARLLAQLEHPGLVEIFDFGRTAQGRPFLVLELLPGPPLRDLLCSGARPVREAVCMGLSLARTLAYVHGQGIVHRDVKPSNILLDADGCPRLADFGISRAVDTAGSTRTGVVMGTAAYLAPEQVTGRGAGPEADVYALGLVLLECLTGEREYPGAPAESAVARLRRPPQVPAGLPFALTRVLDQMLHADPHERISADRSADLLAQALDGSAPVGTAPGPVAGGKELEPTPSADADTQPRQTSAGPVPVSGSTTAVVRRWRRSAAAAAALLAGGGLLWGVTAADGTGRSSAPGPAAAASAPSPGSSSASPASGATGSPRADNASGSPVRGTATTVAAPAAASHHGPVPPAAAVPPPAGPPAHAASHGKGKNKAPGHGSGKKP